MKRFNSIKLIFAASLFAVVFALFPSTVKAQWVYVNDNNYTPSNKNTAYGFKNTGATLTAIAGEPSHGWPTRGTSVVHTDALKDQALYQFSPTEACLYVSEPLASSGDPHGDIAAFFVNTGTGRLTLIAKYPTPSGISNYWGIALTTRQSPATLYAGYSNTSSNKIGVWKILNTKCELKFESQTSVTPLNGGFIDGMAEAPNGATLVVAYVDGSIQTFNTPAYTINSIGLCGAMNSTGFTDGNGGMPAGVDITQDSAYAIFGDVTGAAPPHGPTELEMIGIPIPSTCPSTVDFGGTIVANGSYLGSNIDSTNVRLSPDEHFIYATNNGPSAPQGFTTVAFNESAFPTSSTISLASGCTFGYGNPISLASPGSGFFEPNGIQTASTTGNGSQVYVGEYRTYAPWSAVALLDLDSSGCTAEVSGSPFHDPNGAGGASQLSAWPPRPF